MNRRFFLRSSMTMMAVAALSQVPRAFAFNHDGAAGKQPTALQLKKITRTDAEWKRILTAEQYYITRQKGTEAPYSSPLNDIHEQGTFVCVSCELPLFSSRTKFDSHTGWPSFYAPIAKQNVIELEDKSLGMTRTEVLCARCDAHLGHVFDDGPEPTGLRYCMNGIALKFIKQAKGIRK